MVARSDGLRFTGWVLGRGWGGAACLRVARDPTPVLRVPMRHDVCA